MLRLTHGLTGILFLTFSTSALPAEPLPANADEYLLRPATTFRSAEPVVRQGIISGEHRETHEFYQQYFSGSKMPIPDYLEIRAPISALYRADGSFSTTYLDKALRAAKNSGVPAIELSLISAKSVFSQEIPENIDLIFQARFASVGYPEKMVDSRGVSIENALDSVTSDPGWDRKHFERYSYSLCDRRNQDFILEHIRKTMQHYRASSLGDLIIAWHFRSPGLNDWWYPMNSFFYDYSQSSQKALQHFLREKYDSIEELNRVYGSAYKSFEEVNPPLPQFGKLNLQRAWNDFQTFRQTSIVDFQQKQYRAFMESSPGRQQLIGWMTTAVYTASRDGVVLDNAVRLNRDCPGLCMTQTWFDYYDFTGEVFGQLAAQYGVPVGVEPGRMTMDSFLRTFYNVVRFPVKRVNWLFHIAADPIKNPWICWVLNQRAIVDELFNADLVQEPCANLFSYSEQLALVPNDLWDAQGICEQERFMHLTQDANFNLPMITDYSLEIELSRYKSLAIINQRVLRPEMINKIALFVQRGGKLLLVGESGAYDLESGEKSYPLLRALAITRDRLVENETGIRIRDVRNVPQQNINVSYGAGMLYFRSALASIERGELTPDDEALLRQLGCQRNVNVEPRRISCFEKHSGDVRYYGFINTHHPDGVKAQVQITELQGRNGTALEMISGQEQEVRDGRFLLDFSFQWQPCLIKIIKSDLSEYTATQN